MKSIVLMTSLLLQLTAHATSIKVTEAWNCTFPSKKPGSIITATQVQIKFHITRNEGEATIYPTCRVCAVMPRYVSLSRVVHQRPEGYVIQYSNAEENFNLKIYQSRGINQVAFSAVLNNNQHGYCSYPH